MAFAFLLVAGCTSSSGSSNNADAEELIKKMTAACANLSEDKQIACNLSLAAIASEIRDPSSCANIANPMARNACYSTAAAARKEPSLCDEISDLGDLDACYSKVALSSGNISLCDKVSSDVRNDCYKDFACEYMKPELCAYIVRNKSADYCYSCIAGRLNDTRICDRIGDVFQRETCYIDVAEKTGNASICDAISDNQSKKLCYQRLNN